MSTNAPFPEPGPTPTQDAESTYEPLTDFPSPNIPTLYPDNGPQLIPAPAFPPPDETAELPEPPEPVEPYELDPPE